MSYDISLFEPQFLRRALAEDLGDWTDATPLQEAALQAVRDRLRNEKFVMETDHSGCQEWVHPKAAWGLQVALFNNQIAYSIPYWDDWENAAMYAQQEAKTLAAATGLGYYDAQSGDVIT